MNIGGWEQRQSFPTIVYCRTAPPSETYDKVSHRESLIVTWAKHPGSQVDPAPDLHSKYQRDFGLVTAVFAELSTPKGRVGLAMKQICCSRSACFCIATMALPLPPGA